MVYFFLADGFEEIEALCPVDLCRRVGIDAKTVSITESNVVTGSHGIAVMADLTAKDTLGDFDMIVLPGGLPGTTNLEASPLVQSAIDKALAEEKYIAAICAAPSLLGRWGLLEGREAVCYPGWEDQLTGAKVQKEAQVVESGSILTGRAAGAAFDFGLALIRKLRGAEEEEKVRHGIFYRGE